MYKAAKQAIRKLIYRAQATQEIWFALRDNFRRPNFQGWGMRTAAVCPWRNDNSDLIGSDFNSAATVLRERVLSNHFRLSQFNEIHNKGKLLDSLLWRHYIVFWSARYASLRTSSIRKVIVECGVCDGLTIYFALKAIKSNFSVVAHLYDSWGAMKSDFLVKQELDQVGNYAYLSVEQTKSNLEEFSEFLVFHRGYIPKSFEDSGVPGELSWLHIDLNASMPTYESLTEFYDKLERGGLILFDDYLGQYYPETKVAVDKFLSDKRGHLLPIPTGQAIFFKD